MLSDGSRNLGHNGYGICKQTKLHENLMLLASGINIAGEGLGI